MRIGAFNQVSQVYGSQKVKKNHTQSVAGATTASDKVSFSSLGRDMQVAKTALESVPDIREEKVQSLKEQIANGTYQVSAEDFADKLMAAFDARTI